MEKLPWETCPVFTVEHPWPGLSQGWAAIGQEASWRDRWVFLSGLTQYDGPSCPHTHQLGLGGTGQPVLPLGALLKGLPSAFLSPSGSFQAMTAALPCLAHHQRRKSECCSLAGPFAPVEIREKRRHFFHTRKISVYSVVNEPSVENISYFLWQFGPDCGSPSGCLWAETLALLFQQKRWRTDRGIDPTSRAP